MKRSLKPIFFFLVQLQVFRAVDGHFRDIREASLMRLQDGVTMASSSKYQPTSTESSSEREPTLVSKFWPPFPFDRLGKRGRVSGERSSDGSKVNTVWVRRFVCHPIYYFHIESDSNVFCLPRNP